MSSILEDDLQLKYNNDLKQDHKKKKFEHYCMTSYKKSYLVIFLIFLYERCAQMIPNSIPSFEGH
jgi:hypothetical protein